MRVVVKQLAYDLDLALGCLYFCQLRQSPARIARLTFVLALRNHLDNKAVELSLVGFFGNRNMEVIILRELDVAVYRFAGVGVRPRRTAREECGQLNGCAFAQRMCTALQIL